ncbi:alpha/beta hydrolase [Rhodococcus sp. NPDC058521]|uniref:alpha/beta hydrolase n=1 Tax=Rhodococcus sp. NPDC058521 TaxID=3346536 RepID=UPI00364E3663
MTTSAFELCPTPFPLTRQMFAGTSPQAQVLAGILRRTVKPFLDTWARRPGLPWPAELVDIAGRTLPPMKGTTRRAVQLPHCPAEWIQPTGSTGDRAILYLHGGAFLCCGINTHRQLVSRIATAADARVLNVAYRMIPRDPVRAAIDDGVDGYRWLLAHGYTADRIVIAGDSAGGFLTFAVTLEAMRQGLPRPAANVALSPLTDLDPSRKVAHPNASQCAVFPRRAVPVLSTMIEELDARSGSEPSVSPVDDVLVDMPPALIQTGSQEMTFADAELMAERLAASGVPCELQIWQRQVHVFQAAAGFVPEATRAITEIGEYIRRLTAARLAVA